MASGSIIDVLWVRRRESGFGFTLSRTLYFKALSLSCGFCGATKGDKENRLNATEILKLIGVENPSRMDRNECTQWLRRNGFIFHKNTGKYEVIAKPTAIQIQELVVSDLFS